MNYRKIQVGTDVKGNFSVQITIKRDDPLRPYIIALAERASHKVQDLLTGFVYEQNPESGSQIELEEILMKMLPDHLQAKFAAESDAIKEETVNSLTSGGLGGLLGLMTGNIFQQQTAINSNANLNLLKSTGGSLKDSMDRMLGGSVFAEHVRDQIHKGALDKALNLSANQNNNH